MTQLFNTPESFRDEVLRGFSLAYPEFVRRVPNASGFIRSDGPTSGKVSLVIGGGSGHYPSYSGVVGHGFADGAVLGDVFASPSAEQICRVARAAHGGAGVVLGFGNYAGDRLNFADAADRLASEGIDVRTVFVTDDIASADIAEREKRRGVAGTFVVYKMGGAASDSGADIDAVERLMREANDATVSLGVAFSGCTLPGADRPLFSLEDGQIALGLGIHGEPGIEIRSWMPSRALAVELTHRLLLEKPADSARAALVVNGLGATKYEELFLFFGDVCDALSEAGVDAVSPVVGEAVTSLNMAGCSISLTWLTEELEALWLAPAATASFTRAPSAHRSHSSVLEGSVRPATVAAASGSEASIAAARVVRKMLSCMAETVAINSEEFGRLDAIAGDGDHGIGMLRGAKAAHRAAESTRGGVQDVLVAAGDAFADRAGGTSGILWGRLLADIGRGLGNDLPVSGVRLAETISAAAAGLKRFSRAELGDKTMLDALFPFVDKLSAEVAAGVALRSAWTAAADASSKAAQATAALAPRIGRARPLASRSVGSPDPGAVSLSVIVCALAAVIPEGECAG